MHAENTARNRGENMTRSFFGGAPGWLRVVALVAVMAWVAVFVLAAGGCAAGKQAAAHAKVAAVSDAAADRIESGLAAMPDDPAGTGLVNAEAVRALIPAEWHAAFDRLVESGRSAIDAAALVAGELRTVAAENRAAEDAIRAEIAAGRDGWVLAATQLGAAAKGINPAVGLAVTAITAIGGIVMGNRRGLREGARQTAEVVNAGIFADPAMRDAVKNGPAGDAMRRVMETAADGVVAAAILETKL